MKSTKRPVKKSNSSEATWWLIGIMGAIVALGLIVVVGSQQAAVNHAQTTGNTLGDPNAPIMVEEYADVQCPACGVFARGTLRQIEDKYVKTGKVKILFHQIAFIGKNTTDQALLDLAAAGNDESTRAAEASECANDQGKFWEYADTLFSNQAGENQGAFSDANLAKFAKQLGLDMDKFNACMSDRRYLGKIQSNTNDSQARGVAQTPTVFINGKKYVGAISLVQFETAIGPLLPK